MHYAANKETEAVWFDLARAAGCTHGCEIQQKLEAQDAGSQAASTLPTTTAFKFDIFI